MVFCVFTTHSLVFLLSLLFLPLKKTTFFQAKNWTKSVVCSNNKVNIFQAKQAPFDRLDSFYVVRKSSFIPSSRVVRSLCLSCSSAGRSIFQSWRNIRLQIVFDFITSRSFASCSTASLLQLDFWPNSGVQSRSSRIDTRPNFCSFICFSLDFGQLNQF
jgi:hypothetical protein